jgi:hypothetical protein
MTSWLGPLGPGFIDGFDENSIRCPASAGVTFARSTGVGFKRLRQFIRGTRAPHIPAPSELHIRDSLVSAAERGLKPALYMATD